VAVSFDQIVSRVKQTLMGYTKNQDQITWLTAPFGATDATYTVDLNTTNSLSRGLTECDDELFYTSNFNIQTGVATVSGLNQSGRGAFGTTAASHAIGAFVIADPDFPRARIKEEINNTIRAMYPTLFIFSTFDFPKVAARYEFDLPANMEQVYRVTCDTIGPSRVWFPSQTWRFNPQASTTSDAPNNSLTGKTLQIMDFIVPGRAIHVTGTLSPNVLVNNSDDYATTTGFFERTVDVVVYGATARILAAYESARLQQKAVESTERSPLVPAGAATNAANYFWNLYYRRLNEEQDYLRDLYPEYQVFSS
jgi:hypothetical protein